MAAPRPVLPGQFIFVTRRCTQRQFLLRPDDDTNQTLLYCLALAAHRANMDVVFPSAMSNHHHTALYDREGRHPEFTEHFHKLTARSVNALRGRWENLWASEPPSVVVLADRAAVMDKVVYAATNPVKDGLVALVRHWPGVNGLADLLADRTITVRRPRHFFDPDGDLPEVVTLRYVIPEELGDPAAFRAELRERVAAVEAACAAARARTGQRVLGRRGVRLQSWRGQPRTREPRRGIRPRVAGGSRWARIEALQRDRVFVDRYRHARQLWLAGFAVTFPPGTYWLRRFAPVTVAAVASSPPAGGTATGPPR